MALPTSVAKLGEFKGDKGDKGRPGTFDSATATTVAADQSAQVVITGPEGQNVEFRIPRGLPGAADVPTDPALATILGAQDSETWQTVDSTWLDRDSYASIVRSMGAAFRPQPAFWAYGHSFVAGQGLSPGDYYPEKVASACGMTLTNYAQGGTLAEQAAWRMWGGGAAFPAGHTAVPLLQIMMNSMRLNGDDTPTKRGVEWSWRTCATMATAKAIVPYNDARLTYSGTWAGGADTTYPGGGYRNSSAVGAYVEFTTQTPAKGTAILSLARRAGLAANQIEIRNITAGTTIQTWNNVDQAAANLLGGLNYAPASIILDVPAGTVVRFTNLSGTGIFVGLAELEQVAPRPFIAVKEPKLANWGASTAFPNGSDAATDAFNAIVDTVAADFPNMIVANPYPFWAKAQAAGLVQADEVHPNVAGNERLMLAVIQAASRWAGKASASTLGPITSAPGVFTPAAGVTVSTISATRTGSSVTVQFSLTGSFSDGLATAHSLGTLEKPWRPVANYTGPATAGSTTSAATVKTAANASVTTAGVVTARHEIGATAVVFRFTVTYPAS